MPLYQLAGASRSFRTVEGAEISAIADLTLKIGRGERVALIGPSGAGKTTLFRLLNGTLRPTSGALTFEGVGVGERSQGDMRDMRRRIGTVYQAQHLVPQLSAIQNVLAGRLGSWSPWQTVRARLFPAAADLARARHCLELVEIPEKANAPTYTLSGGQRQRVAIARVLMQDPPVILADEPVSALDPGLAKEILELLLGLHGADRTLIVSLHSVDLALRYFPRVIALERGQLKFDLPASDVMTSHLEALFGHTAAGSPLDAPPLPS
ncbi:MAG: ATP-binding cassette domain-containing protein, partial [Candidatus Sericytochromatia bacterium]|nr:ATP-binding cassette domain-containing protein [Candidatus Tanganyikabacteria bacterium]